MKAAKKDEKNVEQEEPKVEAEKKFDPLKAEIKSLRERLIAQQQQVRDKKLPVLVLVEGWASAGKGSLINELISEIDPRFYNVFSPVLVPESEERYPFLYPYAKQIPENGKIMFYDSGWMEGAVRKYLHRDITRSQYKQRIRSIIELSVSCATAAISCSSFSSISTRRSSTSASAPSRRTTRPNGA